MNVQFYFLQWSIPMDPYKIQGGKLMPALPTNCPFADPSLREPSVLGLEVHQGYMVVIIGSLKHSGDFLSFAANLNGV